MANPEELFDIVDDDDEVIGRAPRSECHGNPALVHRAVHVLIFNSAGELLLQKRATDKDIQPGRWDTSVGGHLKVGESYSAAAYREMHEELGLSGLPLIYLYRSRIRNPVESENVRTYLAVSNAEVIYDPDEISSVRFWTHDEVELSLGKGVLTPNFEDEWAMVQDFARHYQAGRSNRIDLRAGYSFPILWQRLYAAYRSEI